jgi:hypothetical protein
MKGIKLLVIGLLFAIAASSAHALVLMGGDISFDRYGERGRVRIDRLVNFEDVKTGRMRVRIWVSEDEYWEDSHRHYAGQFFLNPVQASSTYHHVRRTVRLRNPSTGWYYVTLTLEERVVGAGGAVTWRLRDTVELDERIYFWRKPRWW